MKTYFIAVGALLASAGGVTAQDHHHHAGMTAPAAICGDTSFKCADKATPFFSRNGKLWVTWSANGRVLVAHSEDLGRNFSDAVLVNRAAQNLDAGADSRPQIAVDIRGDVTVAYTIARDANYNGQVLITRSIDNGRTFAAPKALTSDKASQRFISFALDSEGKVFAAWIDKRNLAAAKKAGKDYAGAALAFSWAEPGGAFDGAQIAKDNTCECCRIGLAFASQGRPAIIWRDLYPGGVRDHSVMTFVDPVTPGPAHRVAVDDWKIDACPHQGPSLAVAADGIYHATWFTDGRARQGVFYARSRDSGQTFSTPMAVGNPDNQPSRPFVFAQDGKVWLTWKEFDGAKSLARLMVSRDGGATWSEPKTIAETREASDHPLLIGNGKATYLSWLTQAEGYRLIPVEATS